ncbi:MAG: hypothetical protein HYX40_12915 [Sphingobacteriales bacterium]|nr:hypothetical protein [Sphingobacteriales bacterium]
MKKRMINLLVMLLMMFLATSSKETSTLNGKCSTMCMQDNGDVSASVIKEEAEEEMVLSPINLFMIHAQ